MRQQLRIDGRVLSYLDSAPSPPGVAQRSAPVIRAGGARGFVAENVLVLIHAFPMNADMWEAQLAAAPAGWRHLAPDLRGFGQSEAGESGDPHSLAVDDHANDVLALLDHLAIERAVVAGLSMGGYAAFALLRLAPSRVRGLVLANTKAEADSPEARNARVQMLDLLEGRGVAAVVEQMIPRLLGETTRATRPGVEGRVRAIAEANSPRGIREAILCLMNRPDATGLLPGIRCPTLVVASDEDGVTPADQVRTMHRRIPGADLAVIRGAGHLSNLEQPGDFTQALHRFLATRFGG
jgi:pimeloyl-ACP methyl ester carboxylesterase